MAENFTLSDLTTLSMLDEGIVRKARVRWAADGNPDYIVDGVLRAFVNQDNNFYDPRGDVRDAYVWISGGFEYIVPVSNIMRWMREGLFSIQS